MRSRQSELYPVTNLREVDGLLEFYCENQYVYQWAVPCDEDDPHVFGRFEKNEPWRREQVCLSEHLLLACMFEAVMCHSPFGASHAWLSPAQCKPIERVIRPLAIGSWRWGATRFYARNGAFMYTMANGDNGRSVFIGAKSREPLAFLEPIVDKTWDYCAL